MSKGRAVPPQLFLQRKVSLCIGHSHIIVPFNAMHSSLSAGSPEGALPPQPGKVFIHQGGDNRKSSVNWVSLGRKMDREAKLVLWMSYTDFNSVVQCSACALGEGGFLCPSQPPGVRRVSERIFLTEWPSPCMVAIALWDVHLSVAFPLFSSQNSVFFHTS